MNKEGKLISVIVPAFNAEKYIKRCVESILKQQENLECIVVDDGSKDKTKEICSQIAEKDFRVRVISKKNTGVSDTRNVGVNNARGEYIAFVDSDDLLPDGALERLKKTIEKSEADIVFGPYDYLYDNKIVQKKMRISPGEYEFSDIKEKIIDDGTLTGILFGSVWGALYRKKIIENYEIKFRNNLTKNEDGVFNIEYLRHANKIVILDRPVVYIYRQWKKQSNKVLKLNPAYDDASKAIKNIEDISSEIENIEMQLARRKLSIAFWQTLSIKNGNINYRTAKRYLKEILEQTDLTEAFTVMDYKHMNRTKRILCKLIQHKQYLLLYITIHFLYVGLSKYIKR